MWGRNLLISRRIRLDERQLRPGFATSAGSSSSSISALRTSETNPANLSASHLGRFYQIAPKTYEDVFLQSQAFPVEFRANCKTFREACVMVRKPFLDIKACVEASDLSKPVVRYILYGEEGVGKSMITNCMAHYGYAKEFVLVYVPWVPLFTRFAKEVVQSPTRPGFFDHIVRAVQWLTQFKGVNSNLITQLNLKTTTEYTWSKREVTPADTPLLEIVDHGISRPAHASEVIYALISELKSLSSSKKCKTMVLMDGVNSIFYEHVKIRKPDRTLVSPNEITVYEAFKQAVKPDWTGGVVICTVDKLAHSDKHRESDLPRYLLSREGWELFDPFVPIKVENFTSREVQSMIDYFLDTKWLQHPQAGSEAGRLELEFLSTRNPRQLVSLCNSR